MSNFIFSANVTLPVFFVIIVGYLLRRQGMLNENFVKVSNTFNFKVTLPALIFHDLSTANIKETFDIGYILFCAAATSICFFLTWGGAKLLLKDKSLAGEFVQASFRGSAAVLGFAFIQNIYGKSEMASLMMIGAVPLYNIYSVLILTLEPDRKKRDKGRWKQVCREIVRNPIILAIFAGLAVSFLDIRFPVMVNKTIQYIAVMATPLALIGIGAGFEGKKVITKIKPTITAGMIKLLIQPLLFLPIAAWLGYQGEKMVALIVMLGSPTTASCYIMAKNMKHEGVLTSSIVVFTTLFASVTLTLLIFILRSFQLI